MANIKYKMGNKLANLSEQIKELNKRNLPDVIIKNLAIELERTEKIQDQIQEYGLVGMVENQNQSITNSHITIQIF